MQEPEGDWPYEGVYRVRGEIPIGYRVGGTAIVADALFHAADKDASPAVSRGLAFVLDKLDDPLMAPSIVDRYDVRVWGQAYALLFLCHLRASKGGGDLTGKIEAAIPKLVQALAEEELRGGGWNYAGRRAPSSFVTASVTQALLLARAQGEKVPIEVLDRARRVLEEARQESGAFRYSGAGKSKNRTDVLPGSIARSPICETTLLLLGGGSAESLSSSLDAFHEHWEELEMRRKKTGTHEGPYGIAPYYFYYGHGYAAQAIGLLPESARKRERERLFKAILRTRDEDGTWNDRVFPRSRNFGTAMIVLALLDDSRMAIPAK